MKSKDFLSSFFWILLGIGICWEGYRLKLGSLHDPGSGFIFFWVGIIMIALALTVLLQAIRKGSKQGEMKALWSEIRCGKIVSILLALILYAHFLTILGFILSSTVLLVFLLKAVEPQSWRVAFLIAILSSLSAYSIFQLWLGSQLPAGILGVG